MYFLESISSQKIDEIKFLKIISIIDSIDGGVGSINTRIFFKSSVELNSEKR